MVASQDKAKYIIRVGVAMSGGVDSAVSAALLKSAGFEVVGVYMRLMAGNKEAELRARQTARQLKIPFKIFDLRQDFEKLIVDKFIAETKKGLTPNPCVICNEKIKFGLLLKEALKMGVDYAATGHYAQIKIDKNGIYHLWKGKDKNKDQSYFLWRLSQKQLRRIIFPIGCLEKSEVRRLAEKWKLPAATAAESQEVCFIGGDMAGFLDKYCGKEPGDIVDETGKVLGRHEGLWFYTLGQRQGIGLAGGPFYVRQKNRRRNELIVAKTMPLTRRIRLDQPRWISGKAPRLPLKARVKIRSRAKDAVALISKSNFEVKLRSLTSLGYELKFSRPQFAPTPGQSAVFYHGNELLGGATIAI